MDLATERNNSKKLYDYLCHKIGTADIVKERRTFLTSIDWVREDNKTFIMSGSAAEGLNMKGSDVDLMILNNSIEVHEGIPSHAKINTFVMCTDDTKPGYTYLKLYGNVVSGPVYWWCIQRGKDWLLSSERLKATYLSMHMNILTVNKSSIHGPCLSDSFGQYDVAYCVWCKSWPHQADSFKTRSRVWPSANLVTNIIRFGVLFVPIGCKISANEELEWRISFSVAEKQLIYSFTHTQFLCYALLKVTLKEIIDKNTLLKGLLCSYFVKTVIFWVSEYIIQSEWRPDNLFTCFKQCLKQLIYFVQYVVLPHFFIDDSNLFSNRFDNFQQLNLMEILSDVYGNNFQWFSYSETMKDFHRFDVSSYLSISDINDCCKQINNLFQMRILKQLKCSKRLGYLFNVPSLRQNKALLWFLFHTECQIFSFSLSHNWHVEKHLLFNDYEQSKCNKRVYTRKEEILAYITLGLRTDAVSGWLYLASYFYHFGAYEYGLYIITHALSKCNPDKLYLRTDQMYPAKLEAVEVEAYQRKLLTPYDIYARHVIHQIWFFEHNTLVPKELKDMLDDFSFLEMSPVAYAHFLAFLCFYHLGDFERCKSALHYLMLTVFEKYFIKCFCQQISGFKMLELGCNMLGDCKSAMSYCRLSEKLISEQIKLKYAKFV